MKRLLRICVSVLSVLVLLGCSTTSNQPTASSQVEETSQLLEATLRITTDGQNSTENVRFEAGDSVMDVLEEYYDIEEENGMVTVIDGKSQDPASNTYWMYKVNGSLAEKGAAEQILQEGDDVEFYLESFQ
ncbi:DUF4430 domain-containing protein [Streptococcus sp. P25B114]|uniref:DUF4430 domain-containing protein n=3 Tax=Streptococcus suis TaxID=1307 RepID=A0A426TA77_STRSU|nr:DUF4430 domain-containing protein [Streptococcus suis]NQI33842.1 DUF4430 domain-containing protein [Streptococcus suis]NQL61330.1 DUF4430 domain-containing protein [Streptococcus suis]NQP18736.1 DUF4430 domain-containing protein [Streptococcus suis]RRR50794.1 DUF4430 domain-containing protein [Streptococcus suis]HEL2576823.1 DUF4430 domain-containing protein [Streptococcus suis]